MQEPKVVQQAEEILSQKGTTIQDIIATLDARLNQLEARAMELQAQAMAHEIQVRNLVYMLEVRGLVQPQPAPQSVTCFSCGAELHDGEVGLMVRTPYGPRFYCKKCVGEKLQ